MNIATKHEPARLSLAPLALPSAWADRTVLLVGAAMLLRLLVASTTGLSDTEAYYAQWARVPALSYYDHPPLVAWTTWIVQRLSTAPWAVRVGPILYAAAFSGLLYRLGARLFSPRAGFLAVALVTAIPAFVFVGFLLNPEGLLAPLWILSLLLLDDLREHDEPWRPLLLGAVIGIAFLAKYTALLAVPVAVLYVAGSPVTRRWLRRPSFYLAGALALAITTPVVAWNYAHDWPSFRLHLAERMVRPEGEGLLGAALRVGSGQFALFHPVILPAFVAVLAYAVHRARTDERYRLLATASLPTLVFLLLVMARAADSEPHWTMVAYAPLAVAAGGVLDESAGRLRGFAWGVLRASLLLSAAVAALYVVHLRSPVLMNALPGFNPSADPLTETLGWDAVRETVEARAAALGPRAVVAGAHNVLCGHLQSALDDTPPVYCASPRRTQFDFVGRRSPPEDSPVVFVDSDRYPADAAQALPRHACAHAEDVVVARGGRVLGRYRLHTCTPLATGAP
jgi:4-amino-4-deoxy-L-arabinose transferase-like glycosyltransferase